MVNFLVSVLFCAIPDSLYLTLFITKIKGVKNKRLQLFLSILIGYIVFIMLLRFNFLLYVLFIVHIYITMKLLYKSKIHDIFVVIIAYVYLIFSCIIGSLFNGINYYLGLTINKIVMFLGILFTNKLSKLYTFYLENWDRSDTNKIKSITLRNISIIIMNVMLIILDLCLMIVSMYFFK